MIKNKKSKIIKKLCFLLVYFNIIVTKFNEKYGIISIVDKLCLFDFFRFKKRERK